MKETVFITRKYAIRVTPVTCGLSFQITATAADDLQSKSLLEWNVVIKLEVPESEKTSEFHNPCNDKKGAYNECQWRTPTQNDTLSISSVVDAVKYHLLVSSKEIYSTIIWATFYWYFHQVPPERTLNTDLSSNTPYSGRPKGNWRVSISRNGIFRHERLLLYMEHLRLIVNEDSDSHFSESSKFFATRCTFWQLDASVYLTLLSMMAGSSETGYLSSNNPPIPLQYVISDRIRHPLRPMHPLQGEQFYARYINSLEQVLSFRVASRLSQAGPSNNEVMQLPLVEQKSEIYLSGNLNLFTETSENAINDVALLHRWMNEPRVAQFWGVSGPKETQDEFLAKALTRKHSFPSIGYWDDKPFGYFEIYWVKEDILGQYLGSGADNWDRGIHCLVGEQDFRGFHRVRAWLSALVHYCFIADNRTQAVMLEPRADNEKLGPPHPHEQYSFEFDFILTYVQTCNLPRRKRIFSTTRNYFPS